MTESTPLSLIAEKAKDIHILKTEIDEAAWQEVVRCIPDIADHVYRIRGAIAIYEDAKAKPCEVRLPSDAELVDLMLKGARLSVDKTSNRQNMHGALKAIQPFLKRESGEADKILRIFMDAQAAFDHGDDVNHMVHFGNATERMIKYFHDKANGIEDERT